MGINPWVDVVRTKKRYFVGLLGDGCLLNLVRKIPISKWRVLWTIVKGNLTSIGDAYFTVIS